MSQDEGRVEASRYWHRLDDGRVQCTLCPRLCKLDDGEHGMCAVRACRGRRIVAVPPGARGAFRVEPVEANGFTHFLPGTLTLSASASACNLPVHLQVSDSYHEAPGADLRGAASGSLEIARCARELGCPSVVLACEPVLLIESALELAETCHDLGIRTIALTRGYVCPAPRSALYRHIDAARVELLAFRERFYWKHCRSGHLAPVLDSLTYLARHTSVWLEIAVPLVAGENDTVGEIDRMTRWIAGELGPEVPLHFEGLQGRRLASMAGSPAARPLAALRACEIARANGLRHVYTDDLFDPTTRGTFCRCCGDLLIGRDWYLVTAWNLTHQNRCGTCGEPCRGVFTEGTAPTEGVPSGQPAPARQRERSLIPAA